MRLIWNLDLNRFVTRISTTSRIEGITLQRQHTVDLEIETVRNDRPVSVGATIGFSLKSRFDSPPIALAELEWNAEAQRYIGTLNLFTVGIENLFSDGQECVELLAGAGYTLPDTDEIEPSETLHVTLANSVHRSSEAVPEPSPTSDTWLSARAIRHDRTQDLSDSQRWAALTNLGFSIADHDVLGRGLQLKLADGSKIHFVANVVA